jgi:putative membrane protein
MLDLTLAIAHHLLIFSLFGVLLAEFVLVRPGVDQIWIRRIGAIDNWYGVTAVLILVVGFSRAVFAAKGWWYYEHNFFFWLKIGTFVLIALLSIPPTIAFIRWRKASTPPSTQAIENVRRLLWAQLLLFALLPAFAAAMARGYGIIP